MDSKKLICYVTSGGTQFWKVVDTDRIKQFKLYLREIKADIAYVFDI